MTKKFESFDIQVSTICNLKCDHCGMHYSLTGEEVDFSKIEEYIDSHNPKEVYLGGGEPLLKDTDKILHIIRRFPRVEFKLVTNLCYPLTEDRINIIREVESLQTSFDIGIRFHNIRNLLQWYRNVKYVLENVNKKLEVIICLTKKLLPHEPRKISKLMHDLGVFGYRYSATYEFGKILTNKDLLLTKEEYISFMNKVLDLQDPLDQTYLVILNGDITSCPYNSYTQAVNCKGEDVHCVCKERWDKKCHNSMNECLLCSKYSICGGKCEMVDCLFDNGIYNKAIEIAKKFRKKEDNE